MIVAIGSRNPTKVRALQQVVREMGFEVVAKSVASSVSSQPLSDLETMQGAINRAEEVLKVTDCHIGIGLEGGITEVGSSVFVCNWGALIDSTGLKCVASGGLFELPADIRKEVNAGQELSEVMEKYTSATNIGSTEGAIGVLTNGLVTRQEVYELVIKILFGQYFKHEETSST